MSNVSPTFFKNISEHRRARFEYTIEETFEAGISLLGWEVKSLRHNRVSCHESYCVIRSGEVFWVGGHMSPLPNVPEYLNPDPMRSRKLLLHKKEINRLSGGVERQGYTLVPLSLYWKNHHIKLKIGLAKGKKTHDKRQTIKEREWKRQNSNIRKQV